jgi:hypothetical protein
MPTNNYRIATVHRGTYAAGTSYVPLDEVTYGTPASTYRNKLACTGVAPTNTTNWTLVSAAGATGATGPAGATGPSGATGADGVGYDNVTSTTTLTLAVGTVTLDVASRKAFTDGMRVRLVSSASRWMEGQITNVTATSITVAVDRLSPEGAGATISSWKVTVTGDIAALIYPSVVTVPTDALLTSGTGYLPQLEAALVAGKLYRLTLRAFIGRTAGDTTSTVISSIGVEPSTLTALGRGDAGFSASNVQIACAGGSGPETGGEFKIRHTSSEYISSYSVMGMLSITNAADPSVGNMHEIVMFIKPTVSGVFKFWKNSMSSTMYLKKGSFLMIEELS